MRTITFALALALIAPGLAAAQTASRQVSEIERPPLGPRPTPPAIQGTIILERGGLRLAGAHATSIPLEAGRTYVIETYGLTASTDTVLEVERGGVTVAENDDVQPGTLWSRVRFVAADSGRYHVRVRPYGASTGGTFGLRVIAVAAAASASATGPK